MEIRIKINKYDLIKLKRFSTTKQTIDKTKRQPTEWKKIFANNATYKGLVSKMYSLCDSISKKKQLHQKMNRRTSHFSREDIQMTKKYVKRCSTFC